MFGVWVFGGFTWRLEISGDVAERPRVAIRDLQRVAGFRIDESDPLRAVHLSRHKWLGRLVN